MERFTCLEAVAAPLLVDNIDTDRIFPAGFVRKVEIDYARSLFANWRFRDGREQENPDFVLNREPFRAARILIAGRNFGCGSSREHAVWALAAFGIRAVIAESFGEIFYDNCFRNGVLPVTLPADAVAALARAAEAGAGRPTRVDLEGLEVTGADGTVYRFALDAGRRSALLEGLDEIGLTLKHEAEIARFQAHDRVRRPWVYFKS